MAAATLLGSQMNRCFQPTSSIIHGFGHRIKGSSTHETNVRTWRVPLPSPLPQLKGKILKTLEIGSRRMLDALVDTVFQFVDEPLRPTQSNFAPVEEIGEAVEAFCVDRQIPSDFPEGVLVRNGPNPLFGGLKSTISIFGRSNHTWVEGEGMLHAVYFSRNYSPGRTNNWTVTYRNRFVESQTFKMENSRGKPAFLPAVEGDSLAILAAYVLNILRFGVVNKYMSNTNVFEHSRKIYVIAENYVPQEIDLRTLEMLGDWNFSGAWNQPFTSHPKKAPKTGELVTMGINATKPYYVLGVISADGQELLHKVDLKFTRSVLSHEIGVTENYNVIIDHPLIFDLKRLIKGGPLLEFDKGGYMRIGVMPRYGDAASVHWFNVEPCCIFHIFNCYEDGDEVIVRGCRALTSVFPGPDHGSNKFEWFSKGFNFLEHPDVDLCTSASDVTGYLFTRVYEWRLNMETGEVNETNVTGTGLSMDFPFIHPQYTGIKNKYGFAQVIDSEASSKSGMAKYGGLAKLYFDQPCSTQLDCEKNMYGEDMIKVEYHNFEENAYCSGSIFVPRNDNAAEENEDDGWIVCFVHDEGKDMSQVHIIDARKFESEPVAKVSLPHRVPYGFHGTFIETK